MIEILTKYLNTGVYMSLKQIECVVMVAKLKSFTKAAHKLITPPINNLNYVIILDGKNRRKKIITKRVV